MEVLIALLAGVLVLLMCIIKYQLKYWQRRGIPHIAPTFPVGNLISGRHFSELLSEVYNKFKGTGPFAGFYLSVQKAIIVLDIALVRNICTRDFRNFHERGSYHNVRDDPLSGNLIFLDGQQWRRLRTKITPAFTSSKMKYMFATVVAVAQELQQVVADMTTAENQECQLLEVTDLMARYTADIIGSTAFGLECNSLRNPQADFVVMGKRFFTHPRHSKVVESLMHSYPKVARKLRLCLISKSVQDFYMRVVRETVAHRETNSFKRADFMDLLIELKSTKKSSSSTSSPATPTDDDQESSGLTLAEIAAQAFVFLVAGFESSSMTMSYALYELARHPAVQSKLRREIRTIASQNKNDITYECMKDMKYLAQVIAETLRLHPVLPFIVRKAHTRYETSDPRYYIDKGTYCFISSLAVHMDPDIYLEPEQFKPERFAPHEVLKRSDNTWLPFGEGPRGCIGARFAKMQISVGLIFLLSRFEFSLAPETKVPIVIDKGSFLLNPKGGIHLRVELV